jgi:hypothetical protein
MRSFPIERYALADIGLDKFVADCEFHKHPNPAQQVVCCGWGFIHPGKDGFHMLTFHACHRSVAVLLGKSFHDAARDGLAGWLGALEMHRCEIIQNQPPKRTGSGRSSKGHWLGFMGKSGIVRCNELLASGQAGKGSARASGAAEVKAFVAVPIYECLNVADANSQPTSAHV